MSFRNPSRNFSSSSLSGLGQRGSMFGSISSSSIGNMANTMRPHVNINSNTFSPDDKETMKGLNDRLAGYLSNVRLMEESNNTLEEQIKDAMMRKSNETGRDWSAYEKSITDVRNQRDGPQRPVVLHVNELFPAGRFESEQAMRQGVEQDLARLRKMLDDTYMSRMQLEGQVESMREELAFLKKNHEEDVANMSTQINGSQVNVHMETKNGVDLSEIITNIRTQYERAAQKSQEETEAWYQKKFENIAAEVTQNTEALQTGRTELNDRRRQIQALEIDLQTLHNMIRSLEDTLRETEARYGQEVGGHNNRIQQLEGELGQVRAQVEGQTAEYQALLNIKMKLEAEIATYHSLLEGVGEDKGDNDRVDFSLEQALYAAPPPENSKKTIIIRQEIEDEEVISESLHEQNTAPLNNQDACVEEDEETPAEQKEDEASSDALEQNE
ncbi:Keratin, type I cytoskeletal 18 [Triplophysa tibetana]|uniref:Keratin, type I cytoskeletal 18 n=1 Tax=Triplophysa tibetana TaxID=1572043 RepID=A0A5A9P0T2_9TELE|nr:Keratin, type I cytoskeletal 18 [Triplophysa tibetana]